MEKFEGVLVFDANFGRFAIAKEDDGDPIVPIEFSDSFEVKVNGEWVETGFEIRKDDEGNLIFKLKNTDFSGTIDGLDVRK